MYFNCLTFVTLEVALYRDHSSNHVCPQNSESGKKLTHKIETFLKDQFTGLGVTARLTATPGFHLGRVK